MDPKLEALQKKYDLLVNLTFKMRHKQMSYFRGRSRQDLDDARKLERAVDQMIKNEIEARKGGQLQLF